MAFSISSTFAPSSLPLRTSTFCSLSTTKSPAPFAFLWFKQDLRLHDHPGLLHASAYPSLLPLYVFDHRILSRYSDEMLEIVLFALEDLRKSLKEQGSNLMIRFGGAENVIRDLVEEVKATEVLAEEENLKDLPASFVELKKLPLTSPLLPPTLPRAVMELDWGSMPTLDELKKFMNENPLQLRDSWTLIKEMSTETVLQNRRSKLRGADSSNLNFKQRQRSRVEKSVFVTQKQTVVGGGTSNILEALAGYLRYLEGTGRDDWQEMRERLHNAEIREGASFFSLFGPYLYLGIISRRQVYYEAIKYEKERNGGFLSPFGYSATTIAATVDTVCSMEWYWLMALKGQVNNNGAYSIRIWRWNGYLIQYTVVGEEGPAVLLVDGFGAFLEHYRDNISPISEGGNRVFAITVLGFGKSEKPNVIYTELIWAELIRDFITDIVGEPVHLVGNSIGGYFISIVACFWPALVKSVVLINSAGDVIPGHGNNLQITKERQTSAFARLGAKLLLPYLRLNIRNIVKKCYPSGMKDPISDSKSKVAMLKEHCTGVVVRELDAGHCPHDEKPEKVNAIVYEWVVTAETKILAESIV